MEKVLTYNCQNLSPYTCVFHHVQVDRRKRNANKTNKQTNKLVLLILKENPYVELVNHFL